MTKTKARQQVQSYEGSKEEDDEVYENIPSRHQRAHGTYQLGQVPRSRPRVQCGRSQHPDTEETSLEELAEVQKAARRLYTLNNLGVSNLVQLAVMRDQFPTLAARTRRICQVVTKTIVTAVRSEIRTALPYIRCYSPEVGEGYLSTEDILDTAPSSTSPIPPSGRNTGINYNLGVPAFEASQFEDEAPPPLIQLSDSDTLDIEVLPQTQVLESSTVAPTVEVEQTEERVATKYKWKKRSHNGRDTTSGSAQLGPLLRVSGQLPGTLQSSGTSVKQTNEELKSVGRKSTQQKAYETASTQEMFESAERYVTPPEAQSGKKEERHRALTSPRKSASKEYPRHDQRTSHHRREHRDPQPTSTGSRDTSRKSRERSRSQIRYDSHSDRNWRPSTSLRQTEVEQLRSEMMKELQDMLRRSNVKGTR